ncbi:SPOR domain-containing protein [Marinobacter sp.]|uniref:SPOR domain-containing protein n=1 Tax=Marinobacter sp. TaxID=50741 RepID=UPI00356ACA0F
MDGLKQRIIGALVLISLAVIFVPMVFDEPHSQRQSTPITIPEEPPFPEVDMPAEPSGEPVGYGLPSASESGTAVEQATAPGFRMIEGDGSKETESVVPPLTVDEAPAKPVKSPEPKANDVAPAVARPNTQEARDPVEKAEFTRSLEGAWVVQLGSFGNEDNARRLRDNVISMGFGAHLQKFSRGDSTLTRVFSGPFVNRADADKAKAALDKEFSLNSLVTQGSK